MANFRPTYINGTGGYLQPIADSTDTLTGSAFYVQDTTGSDTACGVVRPSSAQLALVAGTAYGPLINTTGPTLTSTNADGNGVTLQADGGELAMTGTSGFLFPDQTVQTTSPASIVAIRTTSISTTSGSAVTTGLTASLSSGKRYTMECYIIVARTTGTNVAARFTFTFSGTMAYSPGMLMRGSPIPAPGAAGSQLGLQSLATTIGTPLTVALPTGTTPSTLGNMMVRATFVPLLSGTLTMNFYASTAGEEITVYPGTGFSIRIANT